MQFTADFGACYSFNSKTEESNRDENLKQARSAGSSGGKHDSQLIIFKNYHLGVLEMNHHSFLSSNL
jgi:hypothetical protein